jgi:hypothetical protein
MWAQGISALIGVWLMAAPGVFRFDGPAGVNAHIVGPLIASFGVIAMGECTRGVRRVNLPLALWVVLSPLFLDQPMNAAMNSLIAGVAVGTLSLVRGHVKHRFGGGWAALREPGRPNGTAGGRVRESGARRSRLEPGGPG